MNQLKSKINILIFYKEICFLMAFIDLKYLKYFNKEKLFLKLMWHFKDFYNVKNIHEFCIVAQLAAHISKIQFKFIQSNCINHVFYAALQWLLFQLHKLHNRAQMACQCVCKFVFAQANLAQSYRRKNRPPQSSLNDCMNCLYVIKSSVQILSDWCNKIIIILEST